MSEKKNHIVFFHPDLGIGGAERLVVDAAVGLQNLGHQVTIFTSYCNQSHCFDEARDGTLDVRVRGDWLIPPQILGRFSIFCAILRQLHLILQISFFSSELQNLDPDVFFLDQLSIGIPMLRLRLPKVRVFFYCHFPDKLLAQRKSWLKQIYRIPFDWLEGWSTGVSDVIAVNSQFTQSIFAKAFPSLSHRCPVVVYPCVDTEGSNGTGASDANEESSLWNSKSTFLSINRYERKKQIELAIKAYARLDLKLRKSARLAIAGGYDRRISENVDYHRELEDLADSLGLTHATLDNVITAMRVPSEIDVLFLLSVPSVVKSMLLQSATLLLYTPNFEHFGIVPLEAMLSETPVLAANVGGPTETVVDGETGWLRSVEDVSQWTEVMKQVLELNGSEELRAMGAKGRRRVIALFSKRQMAHRLQKELERMSRLKKRPPLFTLLGMSVSFGIALICGVITAWLITALLRSGVY